MIAIANTPSLNATMRLNSTSASSRRCAASPATGSKLLRRCADTSTDTCDGPRTLPSADPSILGRGGGGRRRERAGQPLDVRRGPVSVVRNADLACPRASRRRTALAAAMAPNGSDLRKLAIVPAYNEQGMVGRVVREIRRHAPGFDVVVVDDGSRRDRRRGRSRRSPRSFATPSTPGSGGRCSRGSSTRCATITTWPPRWTATDSTSRPTFPTCWPSSRPPATRPTWCAAAAFGATPGYKVPFGRRIGNLIFSVVLTGDLPPADHRPDLRVSDDQPPRHRAVRPRLPP